MRRLLVLVVLGLLVFVAVNRQRVFLRDPLARVMRDGGKQEGATVMINYSNDVLVDTGSGTARRLYLVQHWNRVAATPTAPLKCVNGVACMTDADQATASAITPGSRGRREGFEGVTMTNRRVKFVDEDGALVEVELR